MGFRGVSRADRDALRNIRRISVVERAFPACGEEEDSGYVYGYDRPTTEYIARPLRYAPWLSLF